METLYSPANLRETNRTLMQMWCVQQYGILPYDDMTISLLFTHYKIQQWGNNIIQAIQVFCDAIAELLLPALEALNRAFFDLKPYLDDFANIQEQTRQITKKDLTNKRRMARGGKYKPF